MTVPAMIGARLYGRFSDVAFRRLVLILLAICGIMLLTAAVPMLM